jgi:NAD(P)-dependent dehydrogenase (short-subunit alcohol dehydrogenase family)
MKNKTCLITGANSGIGKAAAIELARAGAELILVCRSAAKGEAARDEIKRETGNNKIHLMIADLSIQDQVRGLAAAVRDRFPKLQVLVNNAGAYNGERSVAADGYETTFAVNHLAYFLLTAELIDLLKASAPSRIVNVASDAHTNARIDFDDLQGEKSYSGWKAYGQSKLANVLFTYELARRLDGTKVTANCMHPGVVGTNIFKGVGGIAGKLVRLFTPLMQSPEKGADTLVWLASSPDVEGVTGRYFVDRAEKKTNPESYDLAVAKRLWEVSEQLIGNRTRTASSTHQQR